MRRFTLPLVFFVVSLAVGSWFGIQNRAAVFSAGVERRLAQTAPGNRPQEPGAARPHPSEDAMLTELMSSLIEKEPLLRKHRLREVLGHVDSAQCAALFGRAVDMDMGSRREILLGMVLKRWAMIDPAAATAAARPFLERVWAKGNFSAQSPAFAVSQAWAEAMPETVLALEMARPDKAWTYISKRIARCAVEALADGDPARRLEALSRLRDNPLRAELCADAIFELSGTDPAAAESLLHLLPNPSVRLEVQAGILGKLAARDPSAGLARLAAVAPELTAGADGYRIVSQVLRAAAKKDPTAALAAVEDMPEVLQPHALEEALVGWAEEHPVDALQWAALHGVDAFASSEEIQNPLLGAAFGRDFGRTLEWVRTQPALPDREKMLVVGMQAGTADQRLALFAELPPWGQAATAAGVVQALSQTDGDRAETWVKALPPGAARSDAVRELAALQANVAPERIATLADAWPAGADRDAVLSALSENLVSKSPPRALEFGRRVNDPVTRAAVFEKVAAYWLYRDELAARAWIAAAPELSSQQKHVVLRQFEQR